MTRRGLLATSTAMALALQPPAARADNGAVLAALNRRAADPTAGVVGRAAAAASRNARLEAARGQLDRVSTLAQAGEYASARRQLREGALSTLTRDAAAALEGAEGVVEKSAEGTEAALRRALGYRGVDPTRSVARADPDGRLATDVKTSIATLDDRLRRASRYGDDVARAEFKAEAAEAAAALDRLIAAVEKR